MHTIIFQLYIPLAHGESDEHHLQCCASLPFIPRKHDQLSVLAGDKLRRVKSVSWSAATGIFVSFAIDPIDALYLNALKKLGWKEVK